MAISMMTRISVRLALAFAVVGCFGTKVLPEAMPHDIPAPTTRPDAADIFARFHRFVPTPGLPGHVIGVIVSDVYQTMRVEGVWAQPATLGFASGEGGYRYMLWQKPDAPTATNDVTSQSQVQTNSGIKTYYNLELATADLGTKRGIKPPFSVVDVEVNDGLGCPAGHSFVATHLTVLNGTAQCPLDSAVVMRDATARYEKYKQSQSAAVDQHMAALKPKALPRMNAPGPRQTKELTFITFSPKSQCVQITFYCRTVDGIFGLGSGMPPMYGQQPRNRGPATTRNADAASTGVFFGVESVITFDYSMDGKFVAEKPMPLKDFITKLVAQ